MKTALALLLVLGCSSKSSAPREPVSVQGTWVGAITWGTEKLPASVFVQQYGQGLSSVYGKGYLQLGPQLGVVFELDGTVDDGEIEAVTDFGQGPTTWRATVFDDTMKGKWTTDAQNKGTLRLVR